jgi:hypothetical protein
VSIAVAAGALAAAGIALGGSSGVIHAQHGQVRATLTFEKVRYDFRRIELTIVRPGTRFTHRFDRAYFVPPKLHVRDLDADREPEVWVDTYTGGAHCCNVTRMFHFVAAQARYAGTVHTWGNVDYSVTDLNRDGRPELVSSDDRFAYVFTSFAGSLFPIGIWHIEKGRLVDVTRLFPNTVKRDRAKLAKTYSTFRREDVDVRGVLAAWMADMSLLGEENKGWAALDAAYERGELGPRPELTGWPQGRAYLRTLRTFLRKQGYLPSG